MLTTELNNPSNTTTNETDKSETGQTPCKVKPQKNIGTESESENRLNTAR